jgi:hypothetical protein
VHLDVSHMPRGDAAVLTLESSSVFARKRLRFGTRDLVNRLTNGVDFSESGRVELGGKVFVTENIAEFELFRDAVAGDSAPLEPGATLRHESLKAEASVEWSPPLSGSMSADFDKSLPDANRGIKGIHGFEVEVFRPKVSKWTGEEKVRDGSSVAKLMFFTPALLVHGTPKLEWAGHGFLALQNGDLFVTVPGEVTGVWQKRWARR